MAEGRGAGERSSSEKSSKDESYWSVLSSAIELDVKKGHLKWTVSDLSRKSKVTRSLIYYYFGRSKVDILHEAVKLVGQHMAGVNNERDEMWKKGDLRQSMIEARAVHDKVPFICLFILEHMGKPTEVGEAITEVRLAFEKKISTYFAAKDAKQRSAIFAVYWGMMFAPDVDEEVLTILTKLLAEHLTK